MENCWLAMLLAGVLGPVSERWFDPTDGTFQDIRGSPFSHTGTRQFRTPGANRVGDPDWVLLLEVTR